MNLTKEMEDLEYFCLLCSLSNARQEILHLLNRASVLMKGIIGKILIGGAALERKHSIIRARTLDSFAQILTLVLAEYLNIRSNYSISLKFVFLICEIVILIFRDIIRIKWNNEYRM